MEDGRYLWFDLHHRIIKAGHACNFRKESRKKQVCVSVWKWRVYGFNAD